MQGYWNRPEETAEALRDGWMHTGDLATMDEGGYFKIVGRMKDMINCGGLKVFPDEVDDVLMAHADILEAATIGVPDPRRGETVKSFVVDGPVPRSTQPASKPGRGRIWPPTRSRSRSSSSTSCRRAP